MSRYIDADALMNQWCDEMCKPKPNCEEDCAVYDYVRLAPTIDLVRCKECKYWHEGKCWNLKGLNKTDGVVNADDFCSYGERSSE